MKKQYRRLIFIIFVIFFIITIPVLLIHTAGYRYNFKKTKFEKTGSLLINTKTKNVSLMVNNDYIKNGDEFRINNILPGEYLVKLTKENYFDWGKKIIVKSELTSFIKDVRLFEKNLPTNYINKNISSIYPSNDNKKIAYIYKEDSQYSLWIVDSEADNKKELFKTKEKIEDIRWSPSADKIIVEIESLFKIFDIKGEEIKIPLSAPLKILYWDEKNNNIIYALKNNSIYKIDILYQNYSTAYILDAPISDFRIYQNNLYTIQNYELNQVDLKSNNSITIPLERKDYIINSTENGKIYLTSSKGKMQIFDLPLTAKSTPSLLINATNFNLIGNNLLYYNDFELWTYDFITGQKELITRMGTEIKKAVWLNSNRNILFTTNGEIKIIELDKRDNRQITELIKFENIDNLFLNDKFIIFFIGNVNNNYGLYQLKI